METEYWKDILGFDGQYMVSNLGRVKNNKTKHILKPHIQNKGYLFLSLPQDKKHKTAYIHRLVASAFIPNPDNLPQVNHINEIKTDNRVENLEYCTNSYNMNYGSRNKKDADKKPKKQVLCIELNKVFLSIHDAERETGINDGNISLCCQNKRNTAGGYHWRYIKNVND